MDRRSWLWRRKSSDKSPGETESSGGSISSHSERFSDDQAEAKQNERNDGVKTMSEKLSEALLKISAKDELVKQHAKVAEEAVSGWEKAEREVFALRQKVESLTLRNSTLEDRVGHLDGALKECLRQLRQTREENEYRVQEAIKKKASEWQTTKSQLENQLTDLHSQLQSAETFDLRPKLEKAEKEISALKLELSSMAEELEIRLIEGELSNQAAEHASKLHLDSVKKAAKFEAEYQRLKSALQKAESTTNHGPFWEQLSVVESENLKETNNFESKRVPPMLEIELMDDFLEMERLVSLPENDEKGILEALNNQRSEVEERLKEVETENLKLETDLKDRENELQMLRTRLESAERKLMEIGNELTHANDAREAAQKELESMRATVKVLNERVRKGEAEVMEVKSQLDTARREAEVGLEAANAKKEAAESRNEMLETELEALLMKTKSMENEVQEERSLSGKIEAKCQELKDEISRLQHENQYPKAAKQNAELKTKQDLELAMVGSKFAECQKTIASLNRQLETLATLDDFLINPNDSIEVI